jgi:hypothetical protein
MLGVEYMCYYKGAEIIIYHFRIYP